MRYLRLSILIAVLIAVAFSLGLGLRHADAGACKEAGLKNKCVKGVDIANNSVTTSRVKNNSLKATDLKDEAGADFSSGDQLLDLTASDQIVRSVTITAPRPGVVIVNASGTFLYSFASGRSRCSITTGTTWDLSHLIIAEGSADVSYVPFATTRGYSVDQGSTTFNLVCDEIQGTVSISDTSLTAIYVPTRY